MRQNVTHARRRRMRRYTVWIVKPAWRNKRQHLIDATSTDSQRVAISTLVSLQEKGYTGWIIDTATGERWTPEHGWYQTRGPRT